jgi:hypothetical protein
MSPLCVLGMHRSGTSCLTGSIEQAGVELGKVSRQAPNNLKGNRENHTIYLLNNELLAANGGSWKNPPKQLVWNDDLRQKRDVIIEQYNQLDKRWGFKDPRTVLTLPFWLEALPDMEFVGTFRNPISVAQSLKARAPKSKVNFVKLWQYYNKLILTLYRRKPFPIISFDLDDEGYRQAMLKLLAALSLPLPPDHQEFFSAGLRHQPLDQKALNRLPTTYVDMYWELNDIALTGLAVERDVPPKTLQRFINSIKFAMS